MVAAELVFTVSNHPSAEDFLLSRRKMYEFDRRRYPQYFKGPTHPSGRLWTPSIYRRQSSTAYLSEHLVDTTSLHNTDLGEVVAARLAEREDRAITAALFRNVAGTGGRLREIGRSISVAYTRQYLDSLNASILIGIPGLAYYDDLLAPAPSAVSRRVVERAIELIGVRDLYRAGVAGSQGDWRGFIDSSVTRQSSLLDAWAMLSESVSEQAQYSNQLLLESALLRAISQSAARRARGARDFRDVPDSLLAVLYEAAQGPRILLGGSRREVTTAPSATQSMISVTAPSSPLAAKTASIDATLVEAQRQTKWTRRGVIVAAISLLIGLIAFAQNLWSHSDQTPINPPSTIEAPGSTTTTTDAPMRTTATPTSEGTTSTVTNPPVGRCLAGEPGDPARRS